MIRIGYITKGTSKKTFVYSNNEYHINAIGIVK